MAYVYIVGDYHEYGSENMRATLDRNRVVDLLSDEEDRILAAKYLERSDEDLAADCEGSGLGLAPGWGGWQLFVLKIE